MKDDAPVRLAPHARQWWLALAVAGAIGGASSARAQSGDEGGERGPDPVRESRRAQESFERARRAALPRTWGAAGRCDVRIGRYCYWYDETAAPGPPEPARVAVERRRLLERLDQAATARPDDDWIAGQRVRYWVEAGAPDTAVAAAGECAGTGWWCTALAAYALHAGGRAAEADSAAERALATMPGEERCRAGDLSLLLDGPELSRYRALSCADRAEVEARYWWLATPFFSRDGNERRTEHLARITLSRLAGEARTPYAVTWGRDLHELLVRYGWPESWSRREGTSLTAMDDGGIVGHEPHPAFRFTTELRLADDPFAARPSDWRLRDPQARERYAPATGRLLRELPAAAAVLRRGDSLLVLVDYRLPAGDSLPRYAHQLAIAATRGPGDLRVSHTPLRTPAGADTIRLPRESHLISLEVIGDSGHAARARLAIAPGAGAPAPPISDLVLFVPVGESASGLGDALASPLGGDEVAAPGRLGLYWEMYGLRPGTHRLQVSLVVEGERASWVTRRLDWLRRAPARAPVRMQWTDVAQGDAGLVSRAVLVDLPPMPSGRYLLELRVRGGGGSGSAVARREIVVTR